MKQMNPSRPDLLRASCILSLGWDLKIIVSKKSKSSDLDAGHSLVTDPYSNFSRMASIPTDRIFACTPYDLSNEPSGPDITEN